MRWRGAAGAQKPRGVERPRRVSLDVRLAPRSSNTRRSDEATPRAWARCASNISRRFAGFSRQAPPSNTHHPVVFRARDVTKSRITGYGNQATPPAEIRFFGNNFRSALVTWKKRRGCLQTNHTKPPPAGFGGSVRRSHATKKKHAFLCVFFTCSQNSS